MDRLPTCLTLFALLLAFSCPASVLASADEAEPGGDTADRYTSSKGFSIVPPAGWVTADKEHREAATAEAQRHFQNLRDVDLSQIAVMFFNPEDVEFASNLNVVFVKDRVRPSESNRQKLIDEMKGEYRRMGLAITGFVGEIRTIAGQQSLAVSYNSTIGDMKVSQRQYVVPGGRGTYIVTCTTTQADRDKYEPIFEQAIGTLQVDPPTGLAALTSDIPRPLLLAVVGGAIGLIVAIVVGIARKARPQPAPAAPANPYRDGQDGPA